MTELAKQALTVAHDAFDARADFRKRTVHMSMTLVSIERIVDGVKMAIAVPVKAYSAVTIQVRAPGGAATLTLSHGGDRDLDVVLASGQAKDITIAAKAWSAVLEKPVAVEAGIAFHPTQPRQAPRAKAPRRRESGNATRMATRFVGEDEIIARS